MNFSIFLFSLLFLVNCDLDVHCEWPHIAGTWEFELTKNSYDRNVLYECEIFEPLPTKMSFTEKMILTLKAPNVVIDESNPENKGTFTLIYDQGFEITMGNQIYFMFFNFKEYQKDNQTVVISYCNETLLGWYHDKMFEVGEYPLNWGCMKGHQIHSSFSSSFVNTHEYVKSKEEKVFKIPSQEEIDFMNSQTEGLWESVRYPEEMYRRIDSSLTQQQKPKNVFPFVGTKSLKEKQLERERLDSSSSSFYSSYPESFDWRDVSGTNFVSPVRSQLQCGSCYSFGSTAMYESRIRIASKNALQPILSPQSLVDCSTLSQGCDGGFPYLMSRWGEDMGIVEEKCDPYVGFVQKCSMNKECTLKKNRWFAYDTGYVGDWYGNCDEQKMIEEIVNNGPIAISFEVYQDLRSYKNGVYVHNETLSSSSHDEPHFELTNHVVLITGYGVTDDGVKYWNVKNSWGSDWGDNGYFSIIRGVDNCAIESIAVHALISIKDKQ